MSIPDDLQALEDEVVASLQAKLNEREKTLRRLPAILGENDEQGYATVENMPRWCHARVGSDDDQIKLLNVRTPHTNGLSVVVGYDPAEPELFQVLAERKGLYPPNADNPLQTVSHAPQHEWGNPLGFDPPYLQPRQLRGCRPYVTSPVSLSIKLDGGVYEIGGVLIEWKGSDIEGALDLTTHVPGAGMRWVLITMNAAGPATTAGTAKSLVDLTDIPTSADPTDWRVCAVLLKAGDTAITDWPQEQRIVDLRFAGSRSVSPGGGYITFGNCIVVAKEGGNFDVIQSGLAAATSETHVVILNGQWLEDISTVSHSVTVSGWMDQHFTDAFGVSIVGAGDVGPIVTMAHNSIWSCLYVNRTLAGGSGDYVGFDASDLLAYKHLSDMRVRIEGGSTGRDVWGVKLGAPAGYPSTASRCVFVVADAGSGAAVELVGGDAVFDNMCKLVNEDTGGTALIISGDGVYHFEYAHIEGGVEITGAAEVHFRNCRIAGDLNIAGGGATVYGRNSYVGGNITHGTGDKLVAWAVNQAAGKTITGTGTVVPLWMIFDETSHTDHFIGPVDAGKAAYMRLQPSGSVTNIPPSGYEAFWTDHLAGPANYKAVEMIAARDGINPDFGVLRTIAGGTELPNLPALKLGVGWDESKYITLDENGDILYPNAVVYRTAPTLPPPLEGSTYWNPDERTINIDTGWGPIQQVGHERFARVYNDTGVQIDNGSVVSPTGVYWSGWPGVMLARADSHLTISRSVGMATMDIPAGEFGLATLYGKVRGLNTVAHLAGAQVWASATVYGGWTTIKPLFPNYVMSLGGISVSDASDGVIYFNPSGAPFDTVLNYWNGGFRESFSFTVTSNGTVVTGSLQPSGTATELTMIFSGSLYHFATTPPVLITLTPGTDDVPLTNYIYIPESTKTLTVSTTDWPTGQAIRVAEVLLRSAATTLTDDAYRNQWWNDHVQSDNGQGHAAHVGERMRREPARWYFGLQGTLTIESAPSPDDLFASVVGGKTYQMHLQTFPALDMATGDDMHVVNHPTTPNVTITNLNTQLTDASGGSLAGRHWSFVVWVIQNSGSETCHLQLNLPTGSYNNYDDAINDPDNFSVYDIPSKFEGVGLLNARYTLSHSPSGSGTWTLRATQDLRGFTPNTIAGGGGGAGGATSFTSLDDTFSDYTGFALYLMQITAPETGIEPTNAPTIPDFTNAGHDHADAAGGGATAHSALTNNPHLVTAVQAGAAPTVHFHAHADTTGQTANDHHAVVTLSSALAASLLSLTGQELGLNDQDANYIYGGPVSGAAVPPFFRTMVAADLDSIGWFDQSVKVAASPTFGNMQVPDGGKVYLGTGNDGEIYSSSDDLYIANVTQDKDIYFQINDGAVTKTAAFIQGSTGFFAIGTILPRSELTVTKDGGISTVSIVSYRESSFTHGRMTGLAARGSESSPGQILSGNILFTFSVQGWTSGGAWSNECAIIQFNAAETFTPTGQGTNIRLLTTPIGSPGSSRAERLRVENDGGVFMYNLKSGATAAAAGAATDELWVTSSHATLPDGVVMKG